MYEDRRWIFTPMFHLMPFGKEHRITLEQNVAMGVKKENRHRLGDRQRVFCLHHLFVLGPVSGKEPSRVAHCLCLHISASSSLIKQDQTAFCGLWGQVSAPPAPTFTILAPLCVSSSLFLSPLIAEPAVAPAAAALALWTQTYRQCCACMDQDVPIFQPARLLGCGCFLCLPQWIPCSLVVLCTHLRYIRSIFTICLQQ